VKALQELQLTVNTLPTYEDQSLKMKLTTFFRGIAERGEGIIDSIITKKITTDELCVGSTCVTEAQLQQLLLNNAVAPLVSNQEETPIPDEGRRDVQNEIGEEGVEESLNNGVEENDAVTKHDVSEQSETTE
jgi:hypothetical protein